MLTASSDGDLETAFATMAEHHTGGLIVMPDPFLFYRREQLVGLVVKIRRLESARPLVSDRFLAIFVGTKRQILSTRLCARLQSEQF